MKELELTKRPVDRLIYMDIREIPEIPSELLGFLEEQLPNRFPNLLEDEPKALIHYQGKLDLIAELRYLMEQQQAPHDNEDTDLQLR